MNKLVSIITPSYNSSKFIEGCIDSVISQTFQNWEMIIVDDCSNDNSREIISDLSTKDNRLKFISLKKICFIKFIKFLNIENPDIFPITLDIGLSLKLPYTKFFFL